MQFSDTTNKLGLIQDCEFWTGLGDTGISGTASLLKDFTRLINERYSSATAAILGVNKRFHWDDSNHTDLPIGTFNLVKSQSQYSILVALPDTNQDWLTIERVEIYQEDGNTKLLTPLDKSEVGIAWDEFQETDGTPQYFDFDGFSLKIKPAPSYNYTNGGIIYAKRAPLYFASSDTTKKPGFASIYHSLLSIGASADWCLVNKPDKYKMLEEKFNQKMYGKGGLIEFYSKINDYEKPRITRRKNHK